MGFGLEYLINFYIEEMEGVVYSELKRGEYPVTVTHQEIMSILNGEKESSAEGKSMARKLKEKVLGKSCLKKAPGEYFHIGMLVEMGIAPHEWREYPIHDRAKIIARNWLKNAVEIIDAFDRERESQRKTISEDIKARARARKAGK